MMYRVLLFIPLFLTLSACSFFGEKEDLTEGMTAEQLYAEARGALDSGNYEKAVELYEKLEGRFPFGVYGQQALLDLAYAHFKADEPDSSISAAQRFIKLYPQNPHVDYAYYIKGLANFNRSWTFTKRFLPLDETQRDSSRITSYNVCYTKLLRGFSDAGRSQKHKCAIRAIRI